MIANKKFKYRLVFPLDNSMSFNNFIALTKGINMIANFKVITLCGSTRFRKEFEEAQKRLTLEGNIVITVGLFGHSGDEEVWKPGVKEMLDEMHLRKIDLADEIYVINVDGYIGQSTTREIAYAKSKGKKVNYLCTDKESGNLELIINKV